VLRKSPQRVEAPCAHAGPGRCGGCDWQHATPAAQRALKEQVVREQFERLAGIAVHIVVEALPGGPLGWRTRVTYAVDGQRAGLRRHRSHSLELIDSCPLGVPGVGDSPVLHQVWAQESAIEVVSDELGGLTVLAHRLDTRSVVTPRRGNQPAGGIAPPHRRRHQPEVIKVVDGSPRMRHRVGSYEFEVAAQGFWQVHPAAAATFTDAVVLALEPRPGETVLDLYAGAGLFTAVLADAVGPSGRVHAIESSRQAVADSALNLRQWPWATVQQALVTPASVAVPSFQPDLVVLDPPRSGAGEAVMAAILASAPRAIAYVACDPAALARDVKHALDRGWQLSSLRGFDAFPMTHHVECIAVLTPA